MLGKKSFGRFGICFFNALWTTKWMLNELLPSLLGVGTKDSQVFWGISSDHDHAYVSTIHVYCIALFKPTHLDHYLTTNDDNNARQGLYGFYW